MKKMTLWVLLAVGLASAAYAETAAIPAMQLGKIKSVNLGDPQTGVRPQLVIVDDQGKESTLTVARTATILDKDGKKLTMDKLTAGEKVKIKAIAEGVSSVEVEG